MGSETSPERGAASLFFAAGLVFEYNIEVGIAALPLTVVVVAGAAGSDSGSGKYPEQVSV
jgi:hypothetical protein